jgi:PAT family beta-lactamase induction signal transducer AmpG
VTLHHKLGIVALVYVIEGAPAGIFHKLWPVYFRSQGVGLEEIGWIAGLSAVWSFKALWSPLVDRWSEPRRWIAGSLLAMSACLLALGSQGGAAIGASLWVALAAFCLASATQDVAIDAYTIVLVDRGEEGPANSVRTAAYRAGVLGAGAGPLLLAGWIGWPATFTAAALAWAALAALALACPSLPVPELARRDLLGSLRRWLERPSAAGAALFVLLYRLGDRAMGPMVEPFWIDRGFSNAEIASVSIGVGAFATVAGAVAGGLFVARVGIGRALLALGAVALASNLGYAAAAAWPESGRGGVYAASVVESFSSGLATAAFLSFLMRICEKEHAAVQYAVAYAMSSVAGAIVSIPSGTLAESLGYAAYFAATALFALPAFAFLPAARRWIDAGAGDGSARHG